MAHRKLDRFGFDNNACETFKRNGITTAGDLLEASPFLFIPDLGLTKTLSLFDEVSSRIAPEPQSALKLLVDRSKKQCFLSTGMKILDDVLRGGVSLGTITEICGPPGIGKTQFCFGCVIQSLCATSITAATTSSGSRSVVFLDCELKFSPERIRQMIAANFPEEYSDIYSLDAPHKLDALLQRVKVYRPLNCKELLSIVNDLESIVIENKVNLVKSMLYLEYISECMSVSIVVDSVAALARKENLTEIDKETYLVQLSSQLKRIAEVCETAVLTVNQITPVSTYDNKNNGEDSVSVLLNDVVDDTSGSYRPTLGVIWYHCVSSRYVLSNRDLINNDNSSNDADIVNSDSNNNFSNNNNSNRYFTVVKSPLVPKCCVRYKINSRGIVPIDADDD